MGPRISPGAMLKAASSNSGTICPWEKGGSLPPVVLPLASSVFSLASLAKSAPGCFARAAMFSARARATASALSPSPGLIRMCAALTCSGAANASLRCS